MKNKLKYLVVDSGAFIQKQPLWEHAEELYTVPEVLAEIKDKQTSQFIESFPVKVNFCQPQPASLKFISTFSKKSGDFHVLSLTDLKLLALTHELHVKENGSSNLRLEPLKRITNTTITLPLVNLDKNQTEAEINNSKDTNNFEPIEEFNEVECEGGFDGDVNNAENEDDGWTTITKKRKPKKIIQQQPVSVSEATTDEQVPYSQLVSLRSDLLHLLDEHLEKFSYIAGHMPSPLQETLMTALVHCILTLGIKDQASSYLRTVLKTSESWLLKVLLYLVEDIADSKSTSNEFCNSEFLLQLINCPCEENDLQEYENIRRWLSHVKSFEWFCKPSRLPYVSTTTGATKILHSSMLAVAQSTLSHTQTGDQGLALLEEEEEDDEDDDDDDDEGWITPDNIDQMTSTGWCPREADEGNDSELEDCPVTVACITVDYAMQHVLKHIGLGVLGIDGRIIRELRNFVLRCFTCFTVTPDMSLLFCPKCGHKTLKRVSITTNADGTQNIWISRRRLNTRGFKYNLPKPRGGQHALMPLLTADQRFPHQWAKKAKSVDALDPDFIAGPSPFAARDVNSRAAVHGCFAGTNSAGNAHPRLKHAKIWKPKRKKTVRK
ncbi:RNA-binding protein NOB1 isoform X1 [Hyalella azteca]|uniref:RNA-binding protein NOB1 isoform X1 n=1 Tax=Hyalella azteca TaxID=294128 RepID=A0A8B7NJ29_HYAAZ|nr:RNA-binding protein NOB1 isoform X1 [Hyalella azteca]